MFSYMHLSNSRFHFKRTRLLGAKEMAQQFRAHPEDLGLIASTHPVTDHHSELHFQWIQCLLLASVGSRPKQVNKTPIHIKSK